MAKFKRGDKVEIISKTVSGYDGLAGSGVVKRLKENGDWPFGYVLGYEGRGTVVVNETGKGDSGDYFREKDLLLAKEAEDMRCI